MRDFFFSGGGHEIGILKQMLKYKVKRRITLRKRTSEARQYQHLDGQWALYWITVVPSDRDGEEHTHS